MKPLQIVLSVISAFILIVAIGFGLNMAGFLQFQFFAPKVEKVRYDTFKESQAYNEGAVREMYAYQTQWITATPEQRNALRGAIIHQFSVYPKDRLPADLVAFYAQVQVVADPASSPIVAVTPVTTTPSSSTVAPLTPLIPLTPTPAGR